MATNQRKNNMYIFGIVLAVLTFWLFAQSMINIIPAMQKDMDVNLSTLNIATSVTALFSGLFIVVGGGLADRSGRKKMTFLGLILSIIGSILVILSFTSITLIIGRAIQGISAALIMPATLSLIKTAFNESERQRALSYWSFGSWGGGGVATLAGGLIATYLGWKWIFVFSIAVALISMWILRDITESKAINENKEKFDYGGFGIFVIALIGANLLITQGDSLGWLNPITIVIGIATVVMFTLYYMYEKNRKVQFIDFDLFKSRAYTGAVTSNFFTNAIAANIVVVNIYVQVERGFSSFETGLLTIGNIVALLIMIRVGERMLQKQGARRPMIISIFVSAIGMSLAALTFLPDMLYVIVAFVGFLVAGVGIGMYATPSIDTALAHIDDDKAGIASGVYKMTSSLGYSFGLAISTACYSTILNITGSQNMAATYGILTVLIFGGVALWIVNKTIEPEMKLIESKL
ncbi:MFS transporter [Phocicoccus pinnipedialis]|uniref:Quinolone resistance protein NorB n=1 Tax=Phocicoccus pinnipedialis TaxID=110845 RepID=A0A6V7RMA6_9BACL|nr:MFS transporter [Jeotgalicoccus pinnipedialis]MBP1938819.1 DHA2 family multidrug resistance protein-like MFS transporter [Jeotgalicoccus pinnipedialis]CAD2079285.1 Quinolone resistance protein NorB [Jeotgalicoccus pinnipedialis]